MVFKRIAAVVIWLLVTLTSAFGFLASGPKIAPSDFFSETLVCAGENEPGTRNLTWENGWLHYDTASGCLVAAKKPGSTYTQRYNQTPANGGSWTSGQRAEGVFTSNHPDAVAVMRGEGIAYRNAYANLSPHSMFDASVDNFMDIVRNVIRRNSKADPRYDLHKAADAIMARELGLTPAQVKNFRMKNGYTWHEVEDMRTLQLVPTPVNSKHGHLGGVSEAIMRVKAELGIQ